MSLSPIIRKTMGVDRPDPHIWIQAMLSADEAMLGGIPDREAPLPYIPKALVLDREPGGRAGS